jgi:hypothetical protein
MPLVQTKVIYGQNPNVFEKEVNEFLKELYESSTRNFSNISYSKDNGIFCAFINYNISVKY